MMPVEELQIYHSFEECPVDEFTWDDGDNSLLWEAPWANPDAPAISSKATDDLVKRLEAQFKLRLSNVPEEAKLKRVVPHPRDLHFRMIGWDVLALQRAVSVAGFRPWGRFTTHWGKGLETQVRHFQKVHHLRVDGEYGPSTHQVMAKYYDAYGISLINRVKVKTPAQLRQARLLAAAMVSFNRRGFWHYTQSPMRMWIVKHRLKLADLYTIQQCWEDCSSGITGLRYVAGLDDPNGLHFNGLGFTGTMAGHGTWIRFDQARVGACYLYGRAPFVHVTMNVGQNRAWSNGSETGPVLTEPLYRPVTRVVKYPGLPG